MSGIDPGPTVVDFRPRRRAMMSLGYLLERATDPMPGTGCRLWAGIRNVGGYGHTSHRGRSVVAHRMALLLYFADDPDAYFDLDPSVQVRHLCHDPRCIEPMHLTFGSPRQNVQDSVRAGRHRTAFQDGRCLNGHDITGEGAIYVVPSTGSRSCRECNRGRARKRRGAREESTE